MNPSDVLPPLRAFEIIPMGEGEEESYLLRDPQRFAEIVISVSRPVLFCLQFFDGKTQVATLAEIWKQAANGQELPLEQLAEILEEMDRVFLLDNEHSGAREKELRAEFAAAPMRQHRFAETPEKIGEALEECYREAQLPPPAQIANESNDLGLLFAPHIDYPRGGAAWAMAYGLAKRRFAGEVAVILGVNHQPHGQALALTRKNFATPFGEVRTDTALVDELAGAVPFDPFADEFCHRDEHSIELAAFALRHALGERCPAIVPVLCGSLDDFIQEKVWPAQAAAIAAFQTALKRIVAREGKRLLLIASVDLAHLGPHFGAEQPLDDATMELSLEHDRRLLEHIGKGDAQGFYGALVQEGNARHVCGVAPLYHALSCGSFDGAIEPTLHFWRAPDNSAAVSFASGGLARGQ